MAEIGPLRLANFIDHFFYSVLELDALEIINFPHPTLRHPSKPITRVDPELQQIVTEMFDLMYKAKGIGLAANQVNLPLQMFVINLAAEKGKGEEMVFINPVVSAPKGSAEANEGCLSLAGVEAMVSRPDQIHVSAYDLSGKPIDQTFKGFLARVIQHEYDHIKGVMFIDRISESEKRLIEGEIEEFELEFEAARAAGTIGSDEEINQYIQDIEKRYCS